MNSPLVGQTWSILAWKGDRTTFVITQIAGGRVIGVNVRGGRPVNISLRALVRGRRSARLELEPGGRKPYRPPVRMQVTYEQTRTASDYVKETPPRGLSATERERWVKARREGREWP